MDEIYENIAELVLQSLAFIINAFTVIIIIARCELRKTQNIITCNIALADCLSASLVVVSIVQIFRGDYTGVLWIILTIRSIYLIGVFSTLLVAFHRFIVIRFDPFNKRNLVTAPRCVAVCVIIWVIPFAVFFGFDLPTIFRINRLGLPALIFASTILTSIFYAFVYWGIASAARKAGLSDNMLVQRIKQNKKVLTTFALVVGTNVVCWTPYCLCEFIVVARPDLTFANNDYTPWFRIFYNFARCFQALNGVLNPVIYWTRLTDFRQLLLNELSMCKMRSGNDVGGKSGNGNIENSCESSFQTQQSSMEIPKNSDIGLSGNPNSYTVAT